MISFVDALQSMHHCFCRDAELETAVPSAVRQEPNSQLGPQPDKQSNNPTDAPVMSIWAQIQSLLLPQWQLPLLPTSLASRWQGSGKSEIDVRDSAVAAPDVTNLPSSGASHANPQTSAATRIMHQAQQSCMTLADQLSHQAKLQGLPWPMMSCTRRSALRWRVEWHGLQWSYKQDSLELQLDQHC